MPPSLPWQRTCRPLSLADLLGMHVTTAERWTKIASRDWAHYITARATMSPAEAKAE